MITQQRVAKNVTIMPPDPVLVQRDIRKKRLRVAPYCRVSTDSDEQLNSYEAQIEYYTAKIADNPEWTMVRMYADEGITGTSMKKRKEFLRLIADCKKGRVDLVITKSVTRFARNTLEGLQTVRQLKGLGIGVYFEKENVNTLYMDNEMILTFFFSQAQAESESLSGNVKWGHRKNFQDGKVYYHYDSFLGYKKGEDGQPVVDEEQAKIVRRIYSQYLMGYSVRKICTGLEGDGIRTARGTSEWHDSTVQGILRNEKYIGDAILQKTYVADLFNHQTKKNMGELPKYYVHDCHPAIIDRVTFQKVQEEIARRAGKRKTSSRAKTELGKYSGKYALSEILICGECGSPYRRQTYMPKGEKIYVWRCLNRMENGKRICKSSPTFREEVLHTAIVAAMNEMFSQQAARDVLRESVATALASKQPKMSLPAIENRMRELKARQDELVTLVSCGDATFEAVETEFSKIGEEWNDLKLLHTKLELEQPSSSEIDRRMEQVSSAIEQMDASITEYDDIRTRQLISTIKVLDKETLLIRFMDGAEITQSIEK